MKVLYLHGFASSPGSRKARFFAEKLAAAGIGIEAPDLAQGDFRGLTISGQLRVVEEAANRQPVVLIGSSMGGYLAAIYAAAHPEVRRLVLLAPAFCFEQLWRQKVGPAGMAEWRKKGTMPIFHYGAGSSMDLAYNLMEDAARYEPYPDFSQPALIFHGNADTVVPLEVSQTFVRSHPSARLVELRSGHELTDALDEIWKESNPFLVART